jgi:hypothetical protein
LNVRPWVTRRFPVVSNYRGQPVAVWLGVPLYVAIVAWTALTTVVDWISRGRFSAGRTDLWWVVAGVTIVFLAGLYDDYRPARRGLWNQLRLLGRGQVAPGVVKMAAVGAASVLVAWMVGARGLRLLVGVPVLAATANLWNLLDVVPGRALKPFVPVAAALGAAMGSSPMGRLLLGTAAGALVLLVPDLLELGMLGDAGANVLGFLAGAGMLAVLSTPWLAAVLAALLVLHGLAETVTLSRLIDGAPPLRWLDRLGRRRAQVPPADL